MTRKVKDISEGSAKPQVNMTGAASQGLPSDRLRQASIKVCQLPMLCLLLLSTCFAFDW